MGVLLNSQSQAAGNHTFFVKALLGSFARLKISISRANSCDLVQQQEGRSQTASSATMMQTLSFDVQVPVQLGTAFTSAAQHSWKSPPMTAALGLLLLLVAATPDAGPSSLVSSVRQQLQQSGMLQQLAVVMTAMAADLQAEAATLAAGDGDTASLDIEQLVAGTPTPLVKEALGLQCYLMELWGCRTVPFGFDLASSATWLWGPSGLIAAAMQLQAAMLQHVSAVVQHVQQRAPQQAGALLERLAPNFQGQKAAGSMLTLTGALYSAAEGIRDRGVPKTAVYSLQVLMLPPHTLPFLALVLVIRAAAVRRASGSSHKAGKSSSGSASSSPSRCRSAAGTRQQRQRQQQLAAAAKRDSNSSRGVASTWHTACEAQLLQLLGLTPEVIAMMDEPQDLLIASHKLGVANNVCRTCLQAASCRPPEGPSSAGQQKQPQQRDFEQQLQLLLPAVLLSSAQHMLAPSPQDLQQNPVVEERLLLMCSSTLEVAVMMCGTQGLPAAHAPSVWLQELLGVLLQLADQLLYQRDPTLAQPAAATAGPAGCSAQQQQVLTPAQLAASTAGPAESSTSSNSQSDQSTAAACCEHMLSLLLAVARKSHDLSCNSSSSSSSSNSSGNKEGPDPDSTAGPASPLGARFVEYVTALEAALRANSVTLQSGSSDCTDSPPADVSAMVHVC